MMIHQLVNIDQFRVTLTFLILVIFAANNIGMTSGNGIESEANPQIDRDYTLEAEITGYIGIGGDIDGLRNPVLTARKGDMVRITIVNAEPLAHDIAMDKNGAKSETIIEQGATTSITFKATEDDTYYCTIPGHRAAGMEGQFKVIQESTGEVVAEGVLPQRNGEPIDLDFEETSLKEWTATGEAFSGQPVSDVSSVYGKDANINASGQHFISSGGTKNYEATGTLTSTAFEVTHPFAAFKVSGGVLEDTRVELVLADTDSVFFKTPGNDHERLRPVVVDLRPQMGQEIFIRLIDEETGVSEIPYIGDNIWAHISFDDFRFYSERPEFPDELNPEDIVILPPRDFIENAGLSGQEAAEAMEVPEGFSVTLAASEPEVVRPIAVAMDHRGRLWIAEAHSYPQKAPEGEGEDRILIFEDTDGDGTLDSRKVFIDGLNLVSGLEVGLGAVWVGAAPELLYIPIDETGDKPAGPPQVLLDGWGYQDTHETLSSFRWGPDGWLYGTHGVFTHSNVGRPGTPEDQRQKINAGVWRYHPTRHEFEIYARGMSNIWGLDFNDYGHPFVTVNVLPHLFHLMQGARYQRQAGEHFSPYIYDDIKAHGDHVHWVGENGPHAGNGRSGAVGGGHSHAGAMFYLGAEHWGMDRNVLWMNNIHGARVNNDIMVRNGSGYVGRHREDFLLTNDAWSQWLNYRYGPDGSVFAIDWYDKNQCHSPNPDVHNKTLGRIFRISHEQDEFVQIDLSEKTSLELVEYQLHINDWYVRQARLLLQKRGADEQVHMALREILENNPEVTRKLRALWALHVTEGLTDKDLTGLLDHDSEYIRSWAVQLLAEDEEVPEAALQRFEKMARDDNSALVRLYLASALQRIEPARRWGVLEGLYSHAEDADDHNLPLMVWYAAEPMVEEDVDRALELAMQAKLPNILPYTIRRTGAAGSQQARKALKKVEQKLKSSSGSYKQARQELDQLLGKAN